MLCTVYIYIYIYIYVYVYVYVNELLLSDHIWISSIKGDKLKYAACCSDL